MITVEHRSFAFFLRHRRDEEMITDLNFHRAKQRRDFFPQRFPINNVSAFDSDDLVLSDVGRGKQTTPVNFTLV